jgi:hypothetical protein
MSDAERELTDSAERIIGFGRQRHHDFARVKVDWSCSLDCARLAEPGSSSLSRASRRADCSCRMFAIVLLELRLVQPGDR